MSHVDEAHIQYEGMNSLSTVVYLYYKYYFVMHIVHVSLINDEHVTEINLLIRSYPDKLHQQWSIWSYDNCNGCVARKIALTDLAHMHTV